MNPFGVKGFVHNSLYEMTEEGSRIPEAYKPVTALGLCLEGLTFLVKKTLTNAPVGCLVTTFNPGDGFHDSSPLLPPQKATFLVKMSKKTMEANPQMSPGI